MKNSFRSWLVAATLYAAVSLSLAIRAEDAPATPAANPPTAVPEKPTSVVAAPAPSSAAMTPAEAALTSSASETAPAVKSTDSAEEGALRAIDGPVPAKVSAPTSEPEPAKPARRNRSHSSAVHGNGNDRVALLSNAVLDKDESADSVVAILGNASSAGTVGDAVVAVVGNVRVTGPVGDSVVAVLGNVYVDSKVSEVVAVLGNVQLGQNAEVRGDVVAVGGTVTRDAGAIIHGSIPTVNFPVIGGRLEPLHAYLTECVFKLRLLAFDARLLWAWGVAIGFLLLYVVIALLFRGPVEKGVVTLETRPGGSILTALLTLLLAPVLIVLLCVTIIGIAVVPFLAIGLVIAGLFGKAVILAWLGRQVTRLLGEGPWSHPAVGVLIGGLIALGLYLVPFVGIVVYKTMGVLGLGVVVYMILLASKKEKRRPAVPAPVVAAAMASAVPMATSEPVAGEVPGASVTEASAFPPPLASLAPAASATSAQAQSVPQSVPLETLPRAGFWIRTAALLIDGILLAVVLSVFSGILPHFLHFSMPRALMLGLAAYGAVMWKLKGTTIGGIICGLRVVRVDQRPMDWTTAIVRALGCFLSLVVVGLGFIWVGMDDEKQAWHDKIAGTTVVLVRGSASLV